MLRHYYVKDYTPSIIVLLRFSCSLVAILEVLKNFRERKAKIFEALRHVEFALGISYYFMCVFMVLD